MMPFFNIGDFDPENLPDGMPEELKSFIRKRHAFMERHKTHEQQLHEDMENIWQELSTDQLRTLRYVMHMIACSEIPARNAAFYEGIIFTLLKQRGVCGVCGNDHSEYEAMGLDPHTLEETNRPQQIKDADEFLRSLTEEQQESPKRPPNDTDGVKEFLHSLTEERQEPPPVTSWIEGEKAEPLVQRMITIGDVKFPGELRTHTDLANMDEYNLDEEYDPETYRLIRLFCKGCGMTYQSIEDRMLRRPDECSGCAQKAKFG